MSAVVATAEAASQGGLSLKTKAELSATPPTSSPELLEVKLENMAPNSTTQQASSSSSSNPSEGDQKSTSDNGKRIQNNNTSNYNNGGGRLKFYKEGRCLLELTHRSNTEGQDHWIPIAKKVYWPPPGPVKAESSPSVHSGKINSEPIFLRLLFFCVIFWHLIW